MVVLTLILAPTLAAQVTPVDPPAVAIGALASVEANLPPWVLLVISICVLLSAFFSGSESALFSIHRVRLRSMAEEPSGTGRMVARLLEHPGQLLTTILVGNTLVNLLFTLMLGSRVDQIFVDVLGVSDLSAYLLAVAVCTGLLVFFGEILPKVAALSLSESVARIVVVPLLLVNKILGPVCSALLVITDFIFKITHFHKFRAAPFITDEELKAIFEAREAKAVIEEDERQMIQGILEFNDVLLREIVVPRPDVISIQEDATVAEALELLREHEYSRMPVYREDLDHVTGILIAKDLLPCVARGEWNRTVKTLIKPAHFVPETMTVQQFVKDAQRHRAHLAIVVDEYGGTAGTVALEDAFEEVVGDIQDEHDEEEHLYEKIGDGEYRVDGGLSLEELSELIGVELEDEEHETLAGFLMNHTEKVLEPGDQVEHSNVVFIVEACEGKRALLVRVSVRPPETFEPQEQEA